MSIHLPSHRVLSIVLVVIALITSSLAVVFRIREQKLAAENHRLLAEARGPQAPRVLPTAAQRSQPSVLLDAPISEETALSFFWFGDMESHFRNPVNFFVVPDTDQRLHKVELTDFIADDQANIFVSKGEMKRILEGLKALDLRWYDSRGRKKLESANHRRGTDMLDITLVGSGLTGEAHIRIARMCELLDGLDSAMPTARILWQFRTFRWDNGCKIQGYVNHEVPKE
ncbi:MAG: hypothetical protein JST28_11590 [Acidobacteria bacterium]|nr:hypothetical protein [Acidobacteriota bacterium]